MDTLRVAPGCLQAWPQHLVGAVLERDVDRFPRLGRYRALGRDADEPGALARAADPGDERQEAQRDQAGQ